MTAKKGPVTPTMETTKLYYKDSHQDSCLATVMSCEWNEKKNCYEVILDQTVFFPEGGGQYADTGILGNAKVLDVQEKNEQIIHYSDKPLEPETEVDGHINYPERFSKMQQHTGEHIVSGIVHRTFGYDNVGFHLGQELVTMDFNGTFTEEELQNVELEANEAVVKNLPILVTYPSREELEQLEYRSKKELTGQVRIVEIPGYDVCACCAPHVKLTGEVGIIRLIDAIKYKGGTRVTMVCGFRALKDYRMKESNIREISRMLSAKPEESAQAVKRLQDEAKSWKEKLIQAQSRAMEQILENLPEHVENYLVFEKDVDKNVARRFVDEGKSKCQGICSIFWGNDEDGYRYILGSESVDLKAFSKTFHETLGGKGGGKGEMVQGTVNASEETIRNYIENK